MTEHTGSGIRQSEVNGVVRSYKIGKDEEKKERKEREEKKNHALLIILIKRGPVLKDLTFLRFFF